MVDLTLDVQTRDGEDVSPILMLRQCHLSWEGTLEQARIFTHGVVWNGVLSVLRPLRDYITSIDKLQAFGALEPANLLKWAIVKRFQLLLSGKMTMRKALPSFFGKTRVFDDFEGEWLPTEVDPLPAIKRYGKGKGPADVGFWLKTARLDAWPKLVDIIVHDLADEYRCQCLMPQAKSWSADVLFMAHTSVSKKRMGAAAKRQKQEARMQTMALGSSNLHTLTWGLSVKPIATGTADIIEECKKFEAMFCNLGGVEDKFGNMTNVIVICATKYSSEVQQSFLRRASTRYTVPTTIGCPHITEVLLLDLTTERMRQEFMGLENEPGLTRAMERMVVAACLATSSNE